MNNKHFKLSLVLILLLSLLMAACQPQPTEDTSSQSVDTEEASSESAETPAKEVTLDLDPAGGADFSLVENTLFETLVIKTEDDIFPWLAENGTVANDGLDYIFELRPGVFFQDGTMLDADAVIMNFERWFDKENPLRGDGDFSVWEEDFGGFKGDVDADDNLTSLYDGIEKVNDLTVLIHLNKQDADFFEKIADPAFSILSPAALASDTFIGTGPYLISEDTGSSLSLVPFADYWGDVPEEGLTVDK